LFGRTKQSASGSGGNQQPGASSRVAHLYLILPLDIAGKNPYKYNMKICKKSAGPNMVDAYIGQRIRLRRNMMGMTQKELAARCDITFQQIQKYETSGNRISVSRLFQIAAALETPVTFFFSGLVYPEQPSHKYNVAEENLNERTDIDSPIDPITNNDSLKLINLYWKLPTDAQRRHVMELLELMSHGHTSQKNPIS
jgi:transcriptional regulator with XRE-family HTH domain